MIVSEREERAREKFCMFVFCVSNIQFFSIFYHKVNICQYTISSWLWWHSWCGKSLNVVIPYPKGLGFRKLRILYKWLPAIVILVFIWIYDSSQYHVGKWMILSEHFLLYVTFVIGPSLWRIVMTKYTTNYEVSFQVWFISM